MRALVLALTALAAGCLARIDDSLVDNGDRPPATASPDAGAAAPAPAPQAPGTGSAPPSEDAGGGAAGQPEAGAPDVGSTANGHLVGHWTFEEGTGSTSADLTSGHHDAHIFTGTWTQGYESGGIKLVGTGFVEVPGIVFPTPGTLSLRVLVGPIPPTAGSTLLDQPSSGRNHIFVDQADTNLFVLQSYPTTGDVDQFSVAVSGWHHVVFVWTSASVHAYVDGAAMGSVGNTAGWNASEQYLRIGTNMFITLDDVRLYDVDLPPNSVP